MKPGQSIGSLGSDLLGSLATHPAQLQNVERIDRLIGWLDSLDTPADYSEFQRHLFADLLKAYARRAECKRAARRIASGKPPDKATRPPVDVGLGSGPEAWTFEELVFERLARQLRAVGDGLAWRCYQYDRRAILALSRNDSPGPLIDKLGLGFELGAVEELWKEKGHFALLHDLTNCLRIGDLTEVTSGGMRLLHEVKSSPSGRDGRQQRRMKAAVAAVLDGGELPGNARDARLSELTTPYVTDLSALSDILGLASSHGARGMKLPPGRAVVALDLLALQSRFGPNAETGVRWIEGVRVRAVKRAGLDRVVHRIKGVSGDSAARSPIMAPFAIYPLAAEVRATLICDMRMFETYLDPESLAIACREQGMEAEVLLPLAHGDIESDGPVLSIRRGSRGVTLHAAGLNLLLHELVRPQCWASGISELLTGASPPAEPVLVFADEADTWIPID